MEARRLTLHNRLCNILGSKNVYYKPPENIKLSYPCIIYDRENIDSKKANDNKYNNRVVYNVTLIYKEAINDLPMKLYNAFALCNHSRSFKADNLNHDVFKLYY